jgi:hypothetical protein
MDIKHLGTYKCLTSVKSLHSCESNCIVRFTIGFKHAMRLFEDGAPHKKKNSTSTGFRNSQIAVKYSLTVWTFSSDFQSKWSQLQHVVVLLDKNLLYIPKSPFSWHHRFELSTRSQRVKIPSYLFLRYPKM